jgi:hypothetical protein
MRWHGQQDSEANAEPIMPTTRWFSISGRLAGAQDRQHPGLCDQRQRDPGVPGRSHLRAWAEQNDRKAMAAALKDIYTACNADAAQLALLAFAEFPLGRKYPAAVAVWERAWDRVIALLEFPPALRKALYDKCHRKLQPGNAQGPQDTHPVPQ